MGKLSEKQLKALRDIAEVPSRSGRFWRECGTALATLYVLERNRLIAGHVPSFGEGGSKIRWTITDAGRRALEGQADG